MTDILQQIKVRQAPATILANRTSKGKKAMVARDEKSNSCEL
jgi:hypothetical protein